jgi:phosphate uptake regulator
MKMSNLRQELDEDLEERKKIAEKNRQVREKYVKIAEECERLKASSHSFIQCHLYKQIIVVILKIQLFSLAPMPIFNLGFN